LFLDAVQEELSELGFPEFRRRACEEGGELAAVEEARACGGGAEIAEAEVLGHAVVKLSRDCSRRKRKRGFTRKGRIRRLLRTPEEGEGRN
jgi:hypothetical protein